MTNNPIPILLIILLLKNRSSANPTALSALNSLQLESLLDHIHSTIHTLEKLNHLSHSDLASTLPDVKKMLEVVEKIPL